MVAMITGRGPRYTQKFAPHPHRGKSALLVPRVQLVLRPRSKPVCTCCCVSSPMWRMPRCNPSACCTTCGHTYTYTHTHTHNANRENKNRARKAVKENSSGTAELS